MDEQSSESPEPQPETTEPVKDSPVIYQQSAESPEPQPEPTEPVKDQGLPQPNSKTAYSLQYIFLPFLNLFSCWENGGENTNKIMDLMSCTIRIMCVWLSSDFCTFGSLTAHKT